MPTIMHEKKLKGDLKKKHRLNCVIILDPSNLAKKALSKYTEENLRLLVYSVQTPPTFFSCDWRRSKL